jgi:hypothetical protein
MQSIAVPRGSDNVCVLTVPKLLPREARQVIQRHASLLFREGCLGERRPRFSSSFVSERDRSQILQALISMKETKATKDCMRSLPANTLRDSDLPLQCSYCKLKAKPALTVMFHIPQCKELLHSAPRVHLCSVWFSQ